MGNLLNPQPYGILNKRKLELFNAASLPEWGYAKEQTDTFGVLHPSEECKAEKYPLYVVFHSAGHDVYSAIACTWAQGNCDIYHAPKDMFALYLDTTAPEGFKIPDPPIVVDYSAQDDDWSSGHEKLYIAMREKKYALLGYWGKFGHENNHDKINQVNDLVHSFDLFSVRLDEAYPVFTNASTDDRIPWGEDGSIVSDETGQVNAYFRWGKVEETEDSVSIELRLLTADEWTSRVTFPTESKADVSLRRLQKCHFAAGDMVVWKYGEKSGSEMADKDGLVTIPGVVISIDPTILTLEKQKI